jgi:hypothetical protein
MPLPPSHTEKKTLVLAAPHTEADRLTLVMTMMTSGTVSCFVQGWDEFAVHAAVLCGHLRRVIGQANQ